MSITGLTSDNYLCTITDANGCSKTTDDKSITQPASGMTFDSVVMSGDDDAFNGYQISCNDGNDGSIALTITGGTPGAGYKYTWTTTEWLWFGYFNRLNNLTNWSYSW